MTAEISDPIDKPPDLSNHHGRAWLCDQAEGLRRKGIKPEDDATLAHWVVEAPYAHPFWHSYSVVLIHLREMPDKRVMKIYKPGATHEVWVYAMDPGKDRRPVVETGIVDGAWLSPGNYAGQFIAESDEDALAAVRAAVLRVCHGTLSPDTDYHWQWVHLFGNDMVKEEYR